MNKIFKHKRGASGLKVVCEFAKSHCSSTEKSAINAGDYVASDLKTDKTKYFISGLKTLSIATIFAVAISSIAPVKAIADVKEDYGAEDYGITYVVEGQGGLFLYSTRNKDVKYGVKGVNKDGRGKQATMLNGYIASGEQSTVVGYGARGTHNQATAVGSNTGSYGAQGTAIGNDAYATALGAVAIGNDDMHGNEQDTSTNGKKNLNVSRTYDNHPLTEEELKNDNLQQALYNVFCSKGGSAETNGHCKQDEERLKGFGLKYDETTKKYVLDTSTEEKKANAGKYSLLLAGGQGSISIGSRSISVGEGSTALGVLAKAYGDQSTALGTLSKAMGKNSFALGTNSTATEENSMAFGVNSSATMQNSIAIGYGSKTDYTGSNAKPYMPGNGYAMPMAKSVGVVSVGSNGQPRRIVNLAAGALDTDAVNVSQLKSLAENLGVDDISDNTDKAMRYLSVNRTSGEAKTLQDKIQKEKDFKTYAQYRKYHDTMQANIKKSGNEQLYGDEKTNLEKEITKLEGKYSDFKEKLSEPTALSSLNQTSSEENFKKVLAEIEKYTEKKEFQVKKDDLKKHNATNEGATGADALAFGYDAKAEGENAISIGKGAKAKGNSSINIGGGSIDNLQANSSYRNILIGGDKIQSETGKNDKSNKINVAQKTTKINQTTIIGSENKIDGTELDKSIIMGSRHEINQKQPSTSKLGQNVIIGEKQIIDDSEQATTIGNDIVASGARGGVAIGGDDASTGIYRPTKIEGKASIAMGTGAQALKEGAMSLGLNSEASATNSTALGRLSFAKTEGGVALGLKSTADTEKGKKGLDFTNGGQGAETKQATNTWQSTLAAVSLGGKEHKEVNNQGVSLTNTINTRQITNLAAGTQDTDAVNVAQLKSLGTYVSQGFKVKGKGNGTTDLENNIKFGSTLEFASNNDYLKVTHTKEANGNSKFTFDIDKDKLKQELGNVGGGTGGTTASNLKFKGDFGNEFTAQNTVNIKGGATEQAKLSENNIGVVSDSANTLNVKLAKELKNLTSAEFKNNGNTAKLEADKITFKSNILSQKDVVLSTNGLDNGGHKILNVENPTNETDATNKKYVDELKRTFAGDYGTDISRDGTDGNRKLSVKGGAQQDDLVENNIGVISNANGELNIKLSKILKNMQEINFGDKGAKISVNNEGKLTINNLANPTSDTDAANKKYIDDEVKKSKITLSAGDNIKIDENTNNANTNYKISAKADGKIAENDTGLVKGGDIYKYINNGTNLINSVYFNAEADNTTDLNSANGNKDKQPQKVANTKNIKFAGDENGNVKTSISQDDNGKTTVKFSLNETDLKIGKGGTGGIDGKITVAGKNNSVTIEGKDGSIGLTKDGTNTTITLKKEGKPDIDGTNGAKMNRLTYTTPKSNNTTEVDTREIATLDDGLKFTGNNNGTEIKRKLNEKLTIKGGATNGNETTDENIWVEAKDHTLNIKMAKALKGLTSAEFKNANGDTNTINGDKIEFNPKDNTDINKKVSLGKDGISAGGKTIQNVGKAENDTDAVNKAQAKELVADATKDLQDKIANGMSNLQVTANGEDAAGKVASIGKNDKLNFAAGKNLTATIDKDKKTVTYAMKDDINFNNITAGGKGENGQTGKDGKVTIKDQQGNEKVVIDGKDGIISSKDDNGKDGVTINGKDGSIGINGKDGANSKITVANGKPGVDGKNGESITRIVYKDKNNKEHQVATLDDGLKFAGNTGNTNVKLNQEFQIKGGDSHNDKEWDRDFDQGRNIMTKVNDQKTTIALSKNLTGLNSAEFSDPNTKKTVTINSDKLEFRTQNGNNSSKPGVSINHSGIDMNNQKITNLADATSEKDAVNKGQLDKEIEKLTKNIQNGSNFFFNAEADTNTAQKVENGKSIKFAGDGENNQDGNIKTTITKDGTGKTTVKFALNETDLKLGGKNGKNGKMTVKGADGSSVEIDGAGGKITAKGNGNNVTIDGKAGSIGLIGSDKANATISVKKDGKDLNDADITRLTYVTSNENGKNPTTHQLATLDDGLKFAGNTGNTNVKLNEKFQIKGGESHKDDEWDTKFDQGQNIMTKVENSKTTIALAKNLTGLQSATFGDPRSSTRYTKIDSEGLHLGSAGVNIGHDGINLANKKISDLADAEDEKDAVNRGQVERMIADKIANGSGNANTNIKFKGDNGGDTSAKNGTITLAGGQGDKNKLSDKSNIGVVSEDGKLNFKLAKDIDVDSVKANKITAGGVTIENGKISGVQSSLDPKGDLAKKLAEIDKNGKSDAEKAKEKKAAIQEALKNVNNGNVATVGDLKNITNGLDSVVENVTNITNNVNNITNITNMVANSDDKKKIDEASKAIEEYKKDQNDKNKKAAEDAINANKIKTYNPYGTTVKNNTTIVDAIKNINERGVKFMHISDSDKVGENDDLSVNNNDSQANKKGSIGIGMNAVSDGTDAIATGTNSKASGANAIAMGKGAQATGENTISIGTGNKVTGKNSGAIGDPTEIINADGTYSVGNNNNIKGGDKTTAKDIFALGNDIGSKTTPITDKANGSVILGSKGYSNVKNGVALGYGSNADRDALTDKTSAYNGNDTSVQNTIKGTYGAVSVGDKDNTRQITNVAAGSADSDAVNVAQLKAVANQIKNVSGGQWIAVSNGAKTAPQVANNVKNAVAVGDGSVANRDNTFSVGSAGNERIISNVADGVAPTDAANMRQLQSVANMVGEVKKDAMAGTASAMAIGNLPQATIPGKGMMAVGVGFYKGEQATALGVSKMSENGRWVFKASASYDSQRNVGAAGAIGFHF